MNFIKENKKKEVTEVQQLWENRNSRVQIKGMIYKIRNMSEFSFLLLRTKRDIVQCVLTESTKIFSLRKEYLNRSDLKNESGVHITAFVKEESRSRTGYELVVETMEILSEPSEQSPIVINNKIVDTSLDNLLHFRPVTLRNERERSIFKLQEGIVNGTREFLNKELFTEIRTPKIVYAGAEGGANIFQLDYFGRKAFLTQSPQFYKQMMVAVYERVFEIGPVFRAEKHDTNRHLNEYTSMDVEMGFLETFEDLMVLEYRMLKSVFSYLKNNYEKEIELLKVEVPNMVEIPSMKFTEAKEKIASVYNRSYRDKDDLEPEEEKLISKWVREETGSEFVFITHYPTKKRPFYAMEDPENKEETLSFDLLFRGTEITTGGQRIHQYKEQIKKMEERGMTPSLFESYLMLHRFGICPHGGFGIGLERLTGKLLNFENIRNTTLFPRDMNRLEP